MSDSDSRPFAAEWAEKFYENKDDVHRLLDKVAEERLHDPKSAKQKLSSLITEFKSGEDMFLVLYFTIVQEDDDFMSDLDDNVEDAVYEEVVSTANEYERLTNEIDIVYCENFLHLNNPIKTVDAEISSISNSGTPLIKVAGYSGEMKLFESTDYLINHVRTSAEILNEAVKSAEGYSEKYSQTEELADLASEPSHIETHVEELRDLIDDADPDALENVNEDSHHE